MTRLAPRARTEYERGLVAGRAEVIARLRQERELSLDYHDERLLCRILDRLYPVQGGAAVERAPLFAAPPGAPVVIPHDSPARALRDLSGLTQEALAERIGVSPSVVSQGERVGSRLSIGALRRLALAMGCDLQTRVVPPAGASSWRVEDAPCPEIPDLDAASP